MDRKCWALRSAGQGQPLLWARPGTGCSLPSQGRAAPSLVSAYRVLHGDSGPAEPMGAEGIGGPNKGVQGRPGGGGVVSRTLWQSREASIRPQGGAVRTEQRACVRPGAMKLQGVPGLGWAAQRETVRGPQGHTGGLVLKDHGDSAKGWGPSQVGPSDPCGKPASSVRKTVGTSSEDRVTLTL